MSNFQDGFSCNECLYKCNLFQTLTKEQLEEVFENRYDTSFRAGEVIVKQGAPISNVVSLSDGMAKLVLETPDKPDILLSVVKPTNLITSPGMFLDNRYHYSVVSLTSTKACFISMNIIRKLFGENMEFQKRFHRNVGERSIMLLSRFRNLIHKNMAGRLAEAILFLHDEIYEDSEFHMDLSRSDLAEYSHMTKESVSRILKEFKEEKIFTITNERAKIIDMVRLQQIARNG